MRHTATALGLVMILTAGSAAGAVRWEFSDWDQDGNLELTEREFVGGATELDMFGMWDADDDDLLDEDEFYGGLYDTWDLDADGMIGEDEFSQAADRWLADMDIAGFGDWDEDGDGLLNEEEFRAGIAETGLYDSLVAEGDDAIDEDAFYTGYYETLDVDADEALTEDETAWFEDTLAGQTMTAAEDTTAVGVEGGYLEGLEIVNLTAWQYDPLYTEGWRADWLLDNDVLGPTGEEIGEVEDLIIGPDGRILSLVAEVGGFWDIGDTHVNIPWQEVVLGANFEYAQIPVSEETAEDYGMYVGRLTPTVAATDMVQVDDVETGWRAWRARELIGDYAYLQDLADYGYVTDLVFDRAGELQAVVVEPDVGYGVYEEVAYPYYGYEYGWEPGYEYYELPYTEEEAAELEPFEYERPM